MRRPLTAAMLMMTAACNLPAGDTGVDGTCTSDEELGLCTWAGLDEHGDPVVDFVSDYDDSITDEEQSQYTDETCLEGLEEGDVFECTRTESGGGCEPAYWIECDES
jgi:hypothetical protein